MHRASSGFLRLLFWGVLSFLAVLIPIAAVNIAVDVEGIFMGRSSSSVIRHYVSVLRQAPQGIVLHSKEGIAARLIKLELARQSQADCYVIGASMVELIRRESMEATSDCRELVNLWVPSALYEDALILLAQIADKPTTRKVFIDGAIWSFRRWVAGGRGSQWAEEGLDDRYFGALENAARTLAIADAGGELRYEWAVAHKLLNIGYFSRNWELLRQHGAKAIGGPPLSSPIVVAKDMAIESDKALMMPDGSYVYAASHLERMVGAELKWEDFRFSSRRGNQVYWQIVVPHYGKTESVLMRYIDICSKLRSRGIEVGMIIVPVHPVVWKNEMPSTIEGFRKLEATLHKEMANLGGSVIGSYDPGLVDFTANDFIDARHPVSGALHKLKRRVNANPH